MKNIKAITQFGSYLLGLAALALLALMASCATSQAPASDDLGITVLSSEPDPDAPNSVQVYRLASAAIASNRIKDPIKPMVTVYLPPSYSSSSKSYPVVYYLHGIGNYRDQEVIAWQASFDEYFAKEPNKEFIFVSVPGGNKYGGSYWLNSAATGRWQDFVVKELPKWVESTFRAIPDRKARGLFGFSMGGFGTLRIALKHPEVFSRVYASGSMIPFEEDVNPAALEKWGKSFAVSFLSAAGPAMDQPPPYVWYPEFSGDPTDNQVLKDIWDNAIFTHKFIDNYRKGPVLLDQVFLACGIYDDQFQSNRSLFILLQQMGIPSKLKEFEAGHVIDDDIRRESIVPFFGQLAVSGE